MDGSAAERGVRYARRADARHARVYEPRALRELVANRSRPDLWSLGVIAFECMTGVRPFEGETLVSLALSVCSGQPPRPSDFADVPDGFDVWFARAVAQNPDDRFPS